MATGAGTKGDEVSQRVPLSQDGCVRARAPALGSHLDALAGDEHADAGEDAHVDVVWDERVEDAVQSRQPKDEEEDACGGGGGGLTSGFAGVVRQPPLPGCTAECRVAPRRAELLVRGVADVDGRAPRRPAQCAWKQTDRCSRSSTYIRVCGRMRGRRVRAHRSSCRVRPPSSTPSARRRRRRCGPGFTSECCVTSGDLGCDLG